jgi:hypothetical protein
MDAAAAGCFSFHSTTNNTENYTNAEDIAYDIVQGNQDKMARWVDNLTEELRMLDFTHDECNHVNGELTRDLEVEAMKVITSALEDVFEERERKADEEADNLSLEMSDETRAWARNQLLIYGNVVFRVEDGQLLPGIDFSELNVVLGNAESTLTKVRDALMKKANGG